MCGFIAQLVEQCTGNAEVTGSNPIEALIFFRLLLSNCLNWKIHCDDHSSLSVLSTLSKILEKAVHNQLYYFLNDNKIIGSKQFGFQPKLSTNIALTHFTDNVLLNMDSGRLTGAVFLDLSKAFDTVDNDLLLHKIKSVGPQMTLSIGSSHTSKDVCWKYTLCRCTNNCWGPTRTYNI